MEKTEFYNRVLRECKVYLGDRAERFLERQIKAHLKKAPTTVDYEDRHELAKWIKVSACLVMGLETADKLADKIHALEPKI